MPEPTFTETTERLYAALPGVYLKEDASHDWQLKRWLSGIVDCYAEVDTLIDRIKYVPIEDGVDEADEHSDLVDPDTADAAWLPWLAQLVGLKFDYLITEAQKRERIKLALNGAKAGTKQAIIQAAQSVLIGTKTVYVHPFSDDVGGIGAGTQWDVLVLTIPGENTGDVVQAIINAGAKPAGVVLHWMEFSTDWDTVEASITTWNTVETMNWEQIEQFGV